MTLREPRISSGIRACGVSVGLAAATVLLAAVPVFAQEAGGSVTDSTSGWAFRWINFAVLVAILVYAFAKAAPKFRKNSEEITRKIAEGTRAREAAEAQRREVRTKLAAIDAEVAAMRADAERGARVEAERIRALAKSEAEMIERAAQAEIAAAERASRVELRTAAARMAIEIAEKMLRENLTPGDESALFRAFVGELERSAN